jgi:intracellular sulfur oxidation DsrE/DsrF family protein
MLNKEKSRFASGKTKLSVIIIVTFFVCLQTNIFSQAMDWEYPVVKGNGRIHRLPDAAVQPDKSLEYKVLFGIIHPSEKPEQVSVGLDHVARFINLLSTASMNGSNYKLAVIVGGPAVPLVMDNDNYKAKYGVDNPNTALIKTLKENGVELYVCGQSLGDFSVNQETVDKNFTTALSFMVTTTTYQLKGYSSLLIF